MIQTKLNDSHLDCCLFVFFFVLMGHSSFAANLTTNSSIILLLLIGIVNGDTSCRQELPVSPLCCIFFLNVIIRRLLLQLCRIPLRVRNATKVVKGNFRHSIGVRGGGQRGKIDPVCENQGPLPEEKKRDPTPEKARRPPTKIWPNFHLSPGQNLHEKRFLKNSSPAAPNTF